MKIIKYLFIVVISVMLIENSTFAAWWKNSKEKAPYSPAPDWVQGWIDGAKLGDQDKFSFPAENTSEAYKDAFYTGVLSKNLQGMVYVKRYRSYNPNLITPKLKPRYLFVGGYLDGLESNYRPTYGYPNVTESDKQIYHEGYMFGVKQKIRAAYEKGFKDGCKIVSPSYNNGEETMTNTFYPFLAYFVQNGLQDWSLRVDSEAAAYWKGFYDGNKLAYEKSLIGNVDWRQ